MTKDPLHFAESFTRRSETIRHILEHHGQEILKLRLTDFGLNLTNAERHALQQIPDEFGTFPERSPHVELYEERGPGISPKLKALLATLRKERNGHPVPLDVVRDAWREAQRRRLFSARTGGRGR